MHTIPNSLSNIYLFIYKGRQRSLHLLPSETLRTPRHSIFRAKEERKTNYVSAHVSSYRYADDIMGCY